MKLHWSPRSPFVRKVVLVALEAGIAGRIEFVRSVVAMTRPNPALMRDNPLSRLPTLVLDDGTPLYDSGVIAEYFAGLDAAGTLLPPAGKARWDTLRRQALGDGFNDVLVLWNNERGRPEQHRSPPHLAAYELKIGAALAELEGWAGTDAGRPFDLGDAAIGCALGYADFRFAELAWRAAHPRLAAWQAAFERRPSAIATHPTLEDA
jgi:glutathione S-transferase